MNAKITVTKVDAHPEARYQFDELFYTLVVNGVEICGDRASSFHGIRDAAFSLAHSAAIILDIDIDGRDIQY